MSLVMINNFLKKYDDDKRDKLIAEEYVKSEINYLKNSLARKGLEENKRDDYEKSLNNLENDLKNKIPAWSKLIKEMRNVVKVSEEILKEVVESRSEKETQQTKVSAQIDKFEEFISDLNNLSWSAEDYDKISDFVTILNLYNKQFKESVLFETEKAIEMYEKFKNTSGIPAKLEEKEDLFNNLRVQLSLNIFDLKKLVEDSVSRLEKQGGFEELFKEIKKTNTRDSLAMRLRLLGLRGEEIQPNDVKDTLNNLFDFNISLLLENAEEECKKLKIQEKLLYDKMEKKNIHETQFEDTIKKLKDETEKFKTLLSEGLFTEVFDYVDDIIPNQGLATTVNANQTNNTIGTNNRTQRTTDNLEPRTIDDFARRTSETIFTVDSLLNAIYEASKEELSQEDIRVLSGYYQKLSDYQVEIFSNIGTSNPNRKANIENAINKIDRINNDERLNSYLFSNNNHNRQANVNNQNNQPSSTDNSIPLSQRDDNSDLITIDKIKNIHDSVLEMQRYISYHKNNELRMMLNTADEICRNHENSNIVILNDIAIKPFIEENLKYVKDVIDKARAFLLIDEILNLENDLSMNKDNNRIIEQLEKSYDDFMSLIGLREYQIPIKDAPQSFRIEYMKDFLPPKEAKEKHPKKNYLEYLKFKMENNIEVDKFRKIKSGCDICSNLFENLVDISKDKKDYSKLITPLKEQSERIKGFCDFYINDITKKLEEPKINIDFYNGRINEAQKCLEEVFDYINSYAEQQLKTVSNYKQALNNDISKVESKYKNFMKKNDENLNRNFNAFKEIYKNLIRQLDEISIILRDKNSVVNNFVKVQRTMNNYKKMLLSNRKKMEEYFNFINNYCEANNITPKPVDTKQQMNQGNILNTNGGKKIFDVKEQISKILDLELKVNDAETDEERKAILTELQSEYDYLTNEVNPEVKVVVEDNFLSNTSRVGFLTDYDEMFRECNNNDQLCLQSFVGALDKLTGNRGEKSEIPERVSSSMFGNNTEEYFNMLATGNPHRPMTRVNDSKNTNQNSLKANNSLRSQGNGLS